MGFRELVNKHILRRFVLHIEELKELGYLPSNWLWHKDKLRSLERIEGNLLSDLEELYHTHMLDSEQFKLVRRLLQEMYQQLRHDLAVTVMKAVTSDEQAREAKRLNTFLERIRRLLEIEEKELLHSSQFSHTTQIWNTIPFDLTLNRKYQEYISLWKKETGSLAATFLRELKKGNELRHPLQESDLSSFTMITDCEPLDDLKKRYHHLYVRFAFIMNLGDFQKLYFALYGKRGSAGFVVPLENGVRLIICTGQDEFVYHELRHSIDPYVGHRIGKNRILDEVIAFFGKMLRPVVITQTTTKRVNGKEIQEVQQRERYDTLGQVRWALKVDLYYEQIGWKVSREEYDTEIDKIFDKLTDLSKTHSLAEIDRMLFNTLTIDQLMSTR